MESACERALIGRQLLIHNADALAKAVANSFHIGPSLIEPTGLENISAEEAVARLAGGSSLLISPAADVAAMAPTPKWNVWADGKYTWNDNSPENFDLDGPLWNGLAGFDYKLSDRLTLGVIGSYESSDLDGTGTDLDSEGWGVGPYIGIVLTDNIVFSANVLGSLVDTRQTGPLHFDSERIQATAALNGYWYKDAWRFTPGLSVSWSKEWMDETSNAAPDQDVEAALLTPSVQIGDTLRLSETATVEPWAGTALDWTFVNRIEQSGSPAIDDPNVDLRVQAGLNFGFGANMQLSLTGEAGGLLLDNVDTYSGEANLAIQF
ncbi:MAG: autotransporter outer membrane beta-barrel domain-containing protein [Aestuariivirga sp.]